MSTYKSAGMMIALLCAVVIAAFAQDIDGNRMTKGENLTNNQQKFLESLEGSWAGMCRTWFRPGELADESAIEGEFELILGGRFLRHIYEGKIQDKIRTGEEIIAFNSVTNEYQISWVDDFHMNYGIMFSEGESTDSGFVVMGEYAFDPDKPSWGWKTEYKLKDKDHLIITAFNITPEGEEAKAVETKYIRKKQ